jgi:outer membrane protein TolC
MRSKWFTVVSVGLLCILATGARSPCAAGGAETEIQSAASEGSSSGQPPVLSFPAEGISLMEAVRLTLENDPNIQLEKATSDFQLGLAQERAGLFDTTILADISYEYREQELTESAKEIEQEKRDVLDQAIEENAEAAADAEELLEALRAAQDHGGRLPDAELDGILRLLDALIAQTPAGEAQNQLIDVRNDFLERSTNDVISALTEIGERFEQAQLRRMQLGDVPQDEIIYDGRLELAGSKLFRTGIGISPYLRGSLQGQKYKDKPRDKNFGGLGIEDLLVFRVGLDAAFPLMRGRGADATGALEEAAKIDHRASRLLLQHRYSITILECVLAYWELRTSQELVDVAETSLELQQRLVTSTEALISDGEMAEVEIARVQASRARAEARLDDARRRLHQAQVNLATVMGLGVTDDPSSLPLSLDAFPQVADPEYGQEELAALMAGATENRHDLAAARTLEESSQVRVRGAQTETRPVLDLVLGTWATALGESSATRAVERWVGPSGSLAFSYEQPIGNNFARGRLAQSEADLIQSRISLVDLERQIQLSVVESARSLPYAIDRVKQARDSVAFYQRTVESEMAKFRDGESDLIDTILTEDQKTLARSELVVAQQSLANLVATLRFESGRLTRDTGDKRLFSQKTLITIPSTAEMEQEKP